jgi:hypothetical protein
MLRKPPPNTDLLYQRLTLTIAEFMALSGLCKTTTHKLIKHKTLDAVYAGRRTLITTESVIRHFAPHLAFAFATAMNDNDAGSHPEERGA